MTDRLRILYNLGGDLRLAAQEGVQQGANLSQTNPYLNINAGVGVAGTLGAGLVDATNTNNNGVSNFASGALKGAATGAALGPIGAIGGAAIGGITSIIQGNKEKKAQEEAEATQKRLQNRQLITQDMKRTNELNAIYAEGGQLNITEYNGLNHNQGGIQLGQTGNEVENGETRGIQSTKDYIFSDRLIPEGSKKTFATMSKNINKKYKGLDNDKFAIEAKDKELNNLRTLQEELKRKDFEDKVNQLQTSYPEQFANLSNSSQEATHAMPDGTVMSGATHEEDLTQGFAEYKYGGILNNFGRLPSTTVQYAIGGDLLSPVLNPEINNALGAPIDPPTNGDIPTAKRLARSKTPTTQGRQVKYDLSNAPLSAISSKKSLQNFIRTKDFGIDYAKEKGCIGSSCKLIQNRHPGITSSYDIIRQQGLYGARSGNTGILKDAAGKNISRAGKDLSSQDGPGLDAWELAQVLQQEGQGTSLFSNQHQEELTEGPEYESYKTDRDNAIASFDPSSITVGSIIGAGNAKERNYISSQGDRFYSKKNPETGKIEKIPIDANLPVSNHGATVVEFDDATGDALIYDYGTIRQIGDSDNADMSWVEYLETKNVSSITGLKSNAGFTYQGLKGEQNRRQSVTTKAQGGQLQTQYSDGGDLLPEPVQSIGAQGNIISPERNINSDLTTLRQSGYANNQQANQGIYNSDIMNTSINGANNQQGTLPFRGNLLQAGLTAIPNIATGIASGVLGNNLQYDRSSAFGYTPDYVDPTRAIQEVRDQYSGVKDQIRQVSRGSGNYLSNLIGATAGESKAQAGIQSQFGNINAGISNQAGQFNAQQAQRTNALNAQIAARETQDKAGLYQNAIGNIGVGLNTGIGSYLQSKREAEALNIAGGENFSYRRVKGAGSSPVKVFQGNGYHYYTDPKTSKRVFLDSETGDKLSVKEKNKITKNNKN